MLTSLAIAAGVVLAGIIAMLALLWVKQERIAFQPPKVVIGTTPGWARRVDYAAADGQPLYALVLGDAGSSSATGGLIAFHGNADLAIWYLDWAHDLSRRTGRVVVIAEMRGYGGLAGTPSYAGTALDARAAYGMTRDTLGIPAERIALYGHSLGTAIATELAVETHPQMLILESPFSSAREMANRMAFGAAGVMWNAISRIHFDTIERVKKLDCPIWVAHGDRDLIIPVRMGRAVFAAARTKGELLIVPGGGHDDLPARGGESYWSWVARAVGGTP